MTNMLDDLKRVLALRADSSRQTFVTAGLTFMDDHAPALLAALEDALRWIPVSERLPTRHQRVIVWRETSEIGKRAHAGEDRQDKDGDWLKSNGYQTVTHWMPLPAAPDAQRKP